MELKKPEKRYRRTEAIVLGVAMSALILSACADDTPNPRRCVDPKTGQVTESYKCEDDETSRRYYSSGHGSVGYHHFWYYGGSGYYSGERVAGGSSTPPRSYSAPGPSRSGSSSSHAGSGGISRGGFGAMAVAHAGGGS